VDDRQRLTLVGRASSFVNVAGRKVQPEEVERILRDMPGIRDVRVVAAPDPRRGQQIVACIVADPAAQVGVLDVRRFCSARLASYKIPRSDRVRDTHSVTRAAKSIAPRSTISCASSSLMTVCYISASNECVETARAGADGGRGSCGPLSRPSTGVRRQAVPAEMGGRPPAQEH
jgi:hypothetical protein